MPRPRQRLPSRRAAVELGWWAISTCSATRSRVYRSVRHDSRAAPRGTHLRPRTHARMHARTHARARARTTARPRQHDSTTARQHARILRTHGRQHARTHDSTCARTTAHRQLFVSRLTGEGDYGAYTPGAYGGEAEYVGEGEAGYLDVDSYAVYGDAGPWPARSTIVGFKGPRTCLFYFEPSGF